MCLNCGCMMPNQRHDNPKNIILDDVIDSAIEHQMSLPDTIVTIIKTITCALQVLQETKKPISPDYKCQS